MDQAAIKRRLTRNRRWLRARFIVLLATLSLVANGAVLAPQLGLWEAPHWMLWVLVFLAPIAAVVAGTVSPGLQRQAAEVSSIDRMKAIAAAIIEVGALTGIPIERLGISVWCVYRPRRSPAGAMTRADRRTRYLFRVERFRTSVPSPTDVAWPEGRGVIGRCIAKNEIVPCDYRKMIQDYAGLTDMSEAKWNVVRKRKQDSGFSRAEFLEVIRRYEQVIAVPIVNSIGTVVGCVSLDVTPPPDGYPSNQKVDGASVRACLNQLAATVSPEIVDAAVRP